MLSFGWGKIRVAARRLYERAVAQARDPVFYRDLGVPDTLDGRFDMIALHVFLLLRRLRTEGVPAKRFAQALFDTMFDDMDDSLREIGVGDLSVGKRVKAMAKALYGRIAAYEAGLGADDESLAAALRRNLYRNAAPSPDQLASLAAYLRREAASLARIPYESLAAGEVAFGPAPEPRPAPEAEHPR
ncbi:MAG TPA: ubiquinol-cytochrome C chaperone family protein [Alphaproteobacteria bacterium]|nr:ubiquinol-cytochrome C chaperone family protein [Alphaproteobacteria bacterium]